MNARIVFVHGWGLSPDFWNVLMPFFSGYDCASINLGFLEEENLEAANPSRAATYVTHSLGTLWALKNCNNNMRNLVAINGFSSFRRFASKESLEEMKESLHQNPAAHMESFWEGIGAEKSEEMNVKKLSEGLDWLAKWNSRAELKALNCPVLSLAGAQDKMLPLAQMQKEWAGYELAVCEGGSHMLPQTHADWCAQHIKGFLS